MNNNFNLRHVEEDGVVLDLDKSHELFFKARFGGRYIKSTVDETANTIKELWSLKNKTYSLVFGTGSSEDEAELQED
jgi:hypothetical protein